VEEQKQDSCSDDNFTESECSNDEYYDSEGEDTVKSPSY